MKTPQQYHLRDDGRFPNSSLPVLLYRKVAAPAEQEMSKLFEAQGWTNNWTAGIFTYHHYHSVTHEVLGVCKGQTKLQLGGDDGVTIDIGEGDVLVIPAGVAHKNLGEENNVTCVGGYPGGRDYDMNYGKPEERPAADERIAAVLLPDTDPVYGKENGVPVLWTKQ